MRIVITGSEGFVGSKLKKRLKDRDLFFIDKASPESKGINLNNSEALEKYFNSIDEFCLIHCAATRTDFGLKYHDYHLNNVTATESLLKVISKKKVLKIILLSSVASIEGKEIHNKNIRTNNSDDHYRKTKYLQEVLVEEWSFRNNIPFIILAPSAIYDTNLRNDTNIGKLIIYSNYLPFIPKINVKKSLTNLSDFINFISYLLDSKHTNRKFLCIDRPVKTVSQIIKKFKKTRNKVIFIPFFKELLFLFSLFLSIFSFGGKIDTKLNLQRYKKLFKDTSYSNQKTYEETTYHEFLNRKNK